MKTAIVAGSTGLIGSQLIQLLVEDTRYGKVKCLSRRPLEIQHDKIELIETDGTDLEGFAPRLIGDDVFCCLGTTMKKARSKEAFRKVDYDYPLALATITKSNGASQYHLISAMGANASSSVFYNQVKGEIEKEIEKIGFSSFHIYRPSLLLGSRKEERSAEDAAKIFFKLFGFLIPLQYKAIDSSKVAKAMLTMAKKEASGKFIYESKILQGV